jgi:hypothetical protein
MKGLVLHSLKKKDEAVALVKEGLKCNMRSHVCWHVYGLIFRADRKYNDAIKCYQVRACRSCSWRAADGRHLQQALRLDKENMQILKDLSNLQIHCRFHDGFSETRRQILLLKPNNKGNWIAYAIGNHLVRPRRRRARRATKPLALPRKGLGLL